MQLNLKNPLMFFDLETTGINVSKDRIIEISYLKVFPNGKEESKTMRVNPEMSIPAASTAIHGITDEDVKDCPTFKEIAKSLAAQIEGCDLAGYNSNRFDIPLLAEEFLRAGVDIDLNRRKFVDVQTIFYKMEQRTLSAAYKFYCNKSLENAHTAAADTLATYEVLKAQLDRYPELKNDVKFLSEIFFTHCGTFQMPSRESFAPRGRPFHDMFRRGLLPEREVVRGVLVILPVQRTGPFPRLVQRPSGQDAVLMVLVIFLDIKIYGAVADVGVSCIQYLPYQGYLLDYMSGCPRLDGRRCHIQHPHCFVVSEGVGLDHLHRFELLQSCLLCYLVFPVVRIVLQMSHIGYVPDIAHLVSEVPHKAHEHIVCDSRSCMAEMRVSIYCRAADIKSHMPRIYRCEQFLFP